MAVSADSDFLEFHDLPADAIRAIIERAGELGEAWRERRMPRSLGGKRIALIVDDGGWRNTTAFDLGIQAMGGICTRAPVSLGGREAIADLAGYLDNWFDMIVIRTPELDLLRELAASARGPGYQCPDAIEPPLRDARRPCLYQQPKRSHPQAEDRRRGARRQYSQVVGRGIDLADGRGGASLSGTLACERSGAPQS